MALSIDVTFNTVEVSGTSDSIGSNDNNTHRLYTDPSGCNVNVESGFPADGEVSLRKDGGSVTLTSTAFTFNGQSVLEVTGTAFLKREGSSLDLLVVGETREDYDFAGVTVGGFKNKVVTSVSGLLSAEAHGGNVSVTSGDVEVPNADGFSCLLVAGGAHTVSFDGTSAAMSAGDMMFVVVVGSQVKAVVVKAADQVSFV